MLREFKNKKVSVFGIGRSGLAAADLLQKRGADVFLTDSRPESELRENLRKVSGIPYECGGHTPLSIQTDLIVISPGIPDDIPILKEARELGVSIIGEIELSYCMHPEGWVGITGSNGKTTTTTLIGAIFQHAGIPHHVAGNIGHPAAAAVQTAGASDLVVAELSSFQLETIERFKPQTAVILNLSPDHLDRYADLESYYGAKKNLFRNLNSDSNIILNADDPILAEWAIDMEGKSRVLRFSMGPISQEGAWLEGGTIRYRISGKEGTLIRSEETGLKGVHNTANQLASVAVAKCYSVSDEIIKETLKEFKGLEHRMEFVRRVSHVDYYNDSKATTVESVKYALRSFEQPVHLIAGGYDKGADYTVLTPEVKNHCASVILIGNTAGKMEEAWKGAAELQKAGSMKEAIQMAAARAKENEAVILSPACASFDMFRDYEERGKVFKTEVEAL